MHTISTGNSSQRGIVLPLVAVGLLVLVGMAGLALDLGHAYLQKTRLQNGLDAAALSGAKTLDLTSDPLQAQIDALNTFAVNAGDDLGNGSLTPVIEFSDALIPFVPGGLNPQYVRARLNNMPKTTFFAHVLPGVGNTMMVAASAVAGPSPVLAEVCNILPVMVCGDPNADTDCSDGDCYGYTFDPNSTTETVLKTGAGSGWEVGPGNFQLIRLDGSQGGADIRENLAGSYENCLSASAPIETEPGNSVGPVAQGLNTRFGIYQGPFKPADQATYPPDLVSDLHAPTFFYSDYAAAYLAMNYDHPLTGAAERRIASVPIGDCTGTTNGQGTVPLLGIGCFFLTQPAEQGGQQRVYGQFVTGCQAQGVPGPDPGAGPGPRKIQLYKDPDSAEA